MWGGRSSEAVRRDMLNTLSGGQEQALRGSSTEMSIAERFWSPTTALSVLDLGDLGFDSLFKWG
ncbi:hypothetical protein GJ744_004673 [Endocarpon pusillum]|uniref:Uncharacterized protein n=1 Tax=Endocarpon pusillum TaxID=364733 RepID=A0A8H7ANM4_9EURO|nr:hypothetical protein GJ744_004673 [Endocarpon pusillum]